MKQTIAHPTLLTASQFAAAGNYRAALSLLDTVTAEESSIELYLLRAKILAQQGKDEDAIAQWQRVLTKNPNNREAQQGIKKATQLKSNSMSKFYLRANLYYVLLLFIVLAGSILYLASRKSVRGDAAPIATKQQPFDSVIVATKSSELIETSKAFSKVKIGIPGISVQNKDGSQIFKFEIGLFPSAIADLGLDAKRMLSELGDSLKSQLKPYIGQLSIEVCGHTDSLSLPADSPYRDNEELALARANAVVKYLRMQTSFPLSVFKPQSDEKFSRLNPNDTPENRARNRTVVIYISGKSK